MKKFATEQRVTIIDFYLQNQRKEELIVFINNYKKDTIMSESILKVTVIGPFTLNRY